MNKKFYIKYDNIDGVSWPASVYGLNIYSTEENSVIDFNINKFKDYDQVIQNYRRSEIRTQMFKTRGADPKSFLSVGMPTGLDNQTVSINTVDADKITNYLASGKYTSIQFAFNALEYPEGAGNFDIITKSDYYGRNVQTGKFEKCETGEEIATSYPILTLWYTAYQIKDTGIYYIVTNPDLLAVISEIDGSYNGVDYVLISTEDENFSNELLNPSITNGKKIGQNNIFATADTLIIDILGNSILHRYAFDKIPKEELPKVNLSIESSVPYTVDNNILTLNLAGVNSAFVNYKWVTGTFLDFTKEQLTQSFVITKQ